MKSGTSRVGSREYHTCSTTAAGWPRTHVASSSHSMNSICSWRVLARSSRWESSRANRADVLFPPPRLIDAVRIAFERERPALHVRQEPPRNRAIVRDQIALGVAVARHSTLSSGDLERALADRKRRLGRFAASLPSCRTQSRLRAFAPHVPCGLVGPQAEEHGLTQRDRRGSTQRTQFARRVPASRSAARVSFSAVRRTVRFCVRACAAPPPISRNSF